jgi:hypothetical protein
MRGLAIIALTLLAASGLAFVPKLGGSTIAVSSAGSSMPAIYELTVQSTGLPTQVIEDPL